MTNHHRSSRLAARPNRLVGVLALAGLAAAASCDEPSGKALLQLNVEAASNLSGQVKTLQVDVSEEGASLASGTLSFSPDTSGVASVGLYVKLSGSHEATVVVRGMTDQGVEIARSNPASVTLEAGKASAVISILLLALSDVAPLDGGSGGAGGGGAGGSGGAGQGGAGGQTTDGGVPLPDGALPVNPVWGAAVNQEGDLSASSYAPEVAANPVNGDLHVIWAEARAVKTRKFSMATGQWGLVRNLEPRGDCQSTVIGVDASGHAIAAWVQHGSGPDNTLYGVWTARSDDGEIWSPPQRLWTGPTYGGTDLAVSRTGRARLVFEESKDNINTLFTAYFDGAGWSTARSVMAADNSWDRIGKVAINAEDDGVVVWSQSEPNASSFEESIYSSAFEGATIGPPVLVETNQDRNYEPRVALNPDGRGAIIWDTWANNTSQLWVRGFLTGTGLLDSIKVAEAYTISEPDVAVDTTGNVTAVWSQTETSKNANVFSSYRPMGGVWSTPMPLETQNRADADGTDNPAPRIGVDSKGDVVAVWRRRESPTDNFTFSVWSAERKAGTWSTAAKLSGFPNLRVLWPDFAMGDNGRGGSAFIYVIDNAAPAQPDAPTWEVFTVLRR